MTVDITVLISGRGSNMQAIHRACESGDLQAKLTHVVSNKASAAGLEYAEQHGISTSVINHEDYSSREQFDQALITAIDNHSNPKLVLLAGFMRRLSSVFTNHYQQRLLNIHPSLLPLYPGLNTHARALESGDNKHGCSVHFVNEDLDGGPVVAQAEVPVLVSDNEDSLAARVLASEHQLYPEIAQLFLHGQLECQDSHVNFNGKPLQNPLLYSYTNKDS